jgi:hypothetical protein
MGELVDCDEEHLRLLKYCYYILAGITSFFSLTTIFAIALGALFASGTIPPQAQGPSPDAARTMGLFFLGFGLGALILGLAGSFLTFLVGRSLRDRRRRTFCIVVAFLYCLYVPWGTVIGVCTIIVLNRPNMKTLFGEQPPPQSVLSTPPA